MTLMFETLLDSLKKGALSPKTQHTPQDNQDLKGAVPIVILQDLESINVLFADGRLLFLYHQQLGSEVVTIDKITGQLSKLLYSPLISLHERHREIEPHDMATSALYTVHELNTENTTVFIQWFGYTHHKSECDFPFLSIYKPNLSLSAHEQVALIQEAKAYNKKISA